MPAIAASSTTRTQAAQRLSSVSSNRLLQRGAQGPSVSALQSGLRAAGYNVRVDGDFGPKTQAAVRQFQRDQGIGVDGVAGPQTLGRLRGVLTGDRGDGMDTGARTGGTPSAPRASTTPSAPAVQPRRGIARNDNTSGNPANRTASFDDVVRNAGQRNQMVEGRITVNGNTYDFRSGGFGKGNLPKGDYTITRHLDRRSDRSMNVGGEGYSFAMSNKYDSRVDATRTLLRIHPDGGTPGTEGCVGIVGDAATQRQFRADMLAELRRSGGSFTLSIR